MLPSETTVFGLWGVQSGTTWDQGVYGFRVQEDLWQSEASRLAQWCWLILNAHECTAEELRELFPAFEFQLAIGCLEIISFKTEDKAMHDQREKAQRDYDWMLSTARRQGLEEGIEQGREEGTIHGAIQTLQQILGDVVSSSHELSGRSDVELKTLLAELQERVRSRMN